MDRVQRLMDRLMHACASYDDYGGDLWSRGLEVIQRKYQVAIWLSRFEYAGSDVVRTDGGEVTVAIQHDWNEAEQGKK